MRSQQLSRGGAFLLTIPRSFVKSVAAVTCACFLFTSVFSQAIYAMMETRAGTGRAAAAADGFIVPFNTGRVSDAKFFGSDTVVINIQDLHCHPEAQRNIAKILSIIDDKCRLKKVYIEGGVGEIDTSWVQLIEDKRAREQVVEALMDTGKLTGSEYYSIKSGKTDILAGIEDEKIYNENIKRLGQILDKNKAIQSLLPEIEISLDSLRSRYYTARNRRLDKLIEENKKGAISSGKYYAALMKMAGKSNVDITNYPSITAFLGMEKQQRSMNYKKITRELQGAIGVLKQRLPYAAYDQLIGRMRDAATQDELCLSLSGIAETYKLDLSADFPDLAGFITFVEKSQAINVLKLVSEERKLISELHISQAVTNGEKEVTFIVDQFHCLEEYLDNKISAEAYAYFSRNMPEFKLLRAKYINSDKIAGLEPYNELFERFYQVNVQRNQLFLRNIPGMPPAHARQTAIIPAIDHTRKVIGSLKDAKNIVVLITGGFHTSGVSKLLQEQNISYLVITPNITRDTRISGQVYERLAKEQAAINRQTLALEAYSRRLLSLPVDDRYENINDTFVESELTLMFAADPEASPEEIVNKMNEIGRLLGGALAYDRKNSHGGELRFSYSYKDIKTGRSVATAFTYDRAAGKVFLHDDSSSKSGEMQPASESQSAPEKKSLSGTAAGTELIGLALPVLFGLGFAASFLSGSGDAYVSFHDTLLALFHQLPVTLAGAGISFVSLGSISTAKGSREKAGEIEQDILALPHDRNEFVDSVLRAYGSGGNKEERRKYVAYLSGLETDAKTHNAAIDLLGLLLDRDKAVTEQFLSDIFRFQGLQGEGRGLVLGSQSPRRKDILSRMTGGFETATADIEEYRAESGVSYESGMMLISLQKAFAVAKQKKGIILTGDTLVYHDGQANGKQTEGLELDTLKSYSGNKIKAISSVTVIDTNTGEVKLGYDAASMQMKTLDQRIGLPEIEDVASDKKYAFLKSISNRTELTVKEILENYVRENKSKGKAGAFGVQDRDFFLTVESIEGDPFTIVGFPVETVHDLLSVMKVRVRMIDLVPEYWPSPFEQEKLKPLSNAAIAAEKKHGYESIPLLIDMFVTFYDQLFTGKFFNAGNYWAAAKIRESTNILLREAHRELDTIFSSPSNDIETGITRQVAQEIVDRYRKNDAAVDHVLVELYRKIKKDNYAEAMEILAFMLDSDREISEQFLRDLFIAEKLEVMNTENKKVFLASRSGQRKELLKELFESEPEDPYAVDGQAAAINAEVSRHMHMPVKGGSAKSVLMVIALQKAWAAAIAMRGKNHKGILITAHTAMYDDGMLVEDKDNVENPLAWLRSDNGKNITTVSSVALVDNETGMVKLSSDWANLELKSPDQEISALDIKEILDTSRKDEKYEELKEIFDSASKDAIPLKNILDSYIAQGKAKGKAGGFGIQDRDFFLAVESIEGDPFTIVGFPVERTFPILQEFGIKFKNAELEGLIHKYWPSENERRKINSDNVSMVEAKNQQYEKMEVRDNKLIDELEGFGNPENIAGDAGKEALYIKTYLSHIKLQQRMGKLYDAVSAANDLKAKIRGFSGERSKRLSGYLDELLKHIDLAEMGKSEVEWNHYYLVSLDKQREVNKQLDALLNDYNEWSGSFKEQIKQLEIPLKNRNHPRRQ